MIFHVLMTALAFAADPPEPEYLVARPKESKQVVLNPLMGFTTFQAFESDPLNTKDTWVEGYEPAPVQKKSSKRAGFYPHTETAYIRVYWNRIQPKKEDTFDWGIIDGALQRAQENHQRLALRIMPYGDAKAVNEDVPAWYREKTGEKEGVAQPKPKHPMWRIDHEKSEYLKYFGELIKQTAARYDGNAQLASVDIALTGPWGEGAGASEMSNALYEKLITPYTEGFKKTQLLAQPWNYRDSILLGKRVGLRLDCLGDVGGFSKTWSHMYDLYPFELAKPGVRDAWKSAPVSMEVCWTMSRWKKKHWDIQEILDQALKWHVASFNAKSAVIPGEWRAALERFQKRMGYRLVLRKVACLKKIKPGEKLDVSTWWENKGVTPPYIDAVVALRLTSSARTVVLPVPSDLRTWSPGDVIVSESVQIPGDLPRGDYRAEIALVDPTTQEPKIRMANAGAEQGGWYGLGGVKVE